jgi:transposase
MTARMRSPDPRRGLILMLYWEGVSCRAIACALDISSHTVRRLVAAHTGAVHPPLASTQTASSPDEDTTI